MKITDTQKKAGIIIGLVGAVVLGYFVLRKNPDKDGGTNDPTGNGSAGGDITPVFNAKAIADNLFALMDSYGTKEDEIVIELTNVSQFQFSEVINSFGKPPYYLFGSNEWFGSPLGLVGWLKEELGVTSEEYRTLKLKYPNYL